MRRGLLGIGGASAALRQTPRRLRLFLAIAALLLCLLLLAPPVIAWPGVLIALLSATGFAGAVVILYLFLFPVRFRRLMPGGALGLASHRQLGHWALGLGLAHSLGYLLLEPVTWHDLSLSAPLFMLTGFLCLILLLLLSTTSRQKARSALGRSAIGFRGPHLIASVLLLPLLSLHIAGAGLGLQQSWKSVLWAAVAALAIAGLLRRPHHGTDPF